MTLSTSNSLPEEKIKLFADDTNLFVSDKSSLHSPPRLRNPGCNLHIICAVILWVELGLDLWLRQAYG